MTPSRIGQGKLVQAVGKRRAGNLHVQFISHGEVRDALASRWVFLRKVDLPLDSKLGTPQAYAALQGPQHTAVPLTRIAALEFFKQRDGVESGISLQQRNDLAVPDRAQRVFSGTPVPLWVLRGQTLRVFNTRGASLDDSGFGGRSYLAELVAMLFVFMHLVVRDSLAGHTAYLRFVFEGLTVAPPPSPARCRPLPIPSLIVKAASASYPGLTANEHLCLTAAHGAGIKVPEFALSDDGQMLILDRFDMVTRSDGTFERLGFEDIAALAGLRVRDVLSDRKYQGSYQRIADLLRQLQLHRFFEQVAVSVMIRNGDAHLKNFGVLYRNAADVWLAPMFDVVTTSIYTYTQCLGDPELEDHTLALKLFAGKHKTKAYPTPNELCDFGRRACGVSQPRQVLQKIATSMQATLENARGDHRIPTALLAKMQSAWKSGLAYVVNC